MKKFVSVIVACVLCLLMAGCPSNLSNEEKFYKEQAAWAEQNLNYESFSLYSVDYNIFTGNGVAKEWTDYDFVILSSDNVSRESLAMDFHSAEEFVFRTFSSEVPTIKKGEWLYASVAYERGKEFESVSCTLHYTTTDGEEVSKDYVLDFTETPFRDFRKNRG